MKFWSKNKFEKLYAVTRALVGSRWFLYALLAIFIAQTLIFALIIGERKVPDEHKHFAIIEYYADQPLMESFVINNQSSSDLTLGDIERFPSFLYYIIGSLALRVFELLHLGPFEKLVALRLLSIPIGVFSLLIFRQILLELKSGQVIANLAMFALSMTGMFVYLHGSVSYDPPSLALFLVFLWSGVKVLTTKKVTYLAMAVVAAMAVSITKYTYFPFAWMGVVLLAGYLFFSFKLPFKQIVPDLAQAWRDHRKAFALGVIISIFVAVLFAERIGGNLMMYGSISPACDAIHSHEECMNYSIYKRNYTQDQKIADKRSKWGIVEADHFAVTGSWLEQMYRSTYFFGGHVYAIPRQAERALAFLIFVLLLGMMLLPRRPVLDSKERLFVGVMAVLYLVGVYAFNMKTRFILGQQYAWQGRYLLASTAFMYFILLLFYQYHWHAMKNWRIKYTVMLASIGLVIVLLATFVPLLNLYRHADATWLNPPAREFFTHMGIIEK